MFAWLKKIFVVPNALHTDALTAATSIAHQSRGDKYLGESHFEDAAECYRQAVLINPNNCEAYCGLGMVYLQQNLYENAEHYLKEAISADPKLAQAYYLLGTALQKQGKLTAAAENFNKAQELKPDAEIVYADLCYTLFQLGQIEAAKQTALQGIAVNPNFADFHFFLGNLFSHEKAFDRAIACYQNALTIQPGHVMAYLNLKHLLEERGNLDMAITCYRNVLKLNPSFANAHLDLGEALQKQGALDNAIDCYRRAIALKPDLLEAHNNLGGIFANQGKPNEAITCYQQALATSPDSAVLCYNLALAYKVCGRFSEAIAYYQKAVALQPEFAEAHYNQGNAYFELGQLNNAATCYHKALEINSGSANAWYGLGATLVAQQKNLEAASCFRRALEIEPSHLSARTLLLYQLQHMCEWENIDVHVKALRQTAVETPTSGKNQAPPLVFLAIPNATAKEQKRATEKWVHGEFATIESFRDKLGFEFDRAPNDKIRIGYLSADLRQHPVSFLLAEVFELHDRSRFHITAYSYGTDDDSPMRRRLEKAFDRFVDIQNDSYEEAARKIYADRTDILVDLTGHTQNSRSGILALRPAPIQVNYLGYPGTMGAKFVDYLIADRFTIPPEMRQHYTEKIIWMPDCFQANDSKRPRPKSPSRTECGLPESGFVFCCFNQTFKITPEIFDIWCRLLTSVPDSTLWLAESNPQAKINLMREAENRGVEPERIIMAPLLHRDEHLARLQCADLFLDTLPFNAGTTCSDALWMGLPVITCAGDAFASRMAGSLLAAIGAPELITYNLEDYCSLALGLATDRNKLDAIRSKIITSRDTTPLFDSKLFTLNLEKTYTKMVDERTRNIYLP